MAVESVQRSVWEFGGRSSTSYTSYNNLTEMPEYQRQLGCFNLGNIEFPANIDSNANWFHKIFYFGDYWKANDSSYREIRTASDGADLSDSSPASFTKRRWKFEQKSRPALFGAEFAQELGFCELEIPLHRTRGCFEHSGDFFLGQAAEVTHFQNLGLARGHLRKRIECRIQCHQRFRRLRCQ